jgi:hypothetical protein
VLPPKNVISYLHTNQARIARMVENYFFVIIKSSIKCFLSGLPESFMFIIILTFNELFLHINMPLDILILPPLWLHDDSLRQMQQLADISALLFCRPIVLLGCGSF